MRIGWWWGCSDGEPIYAPGMVVSLFTRVRTKEMHRVAGTVLLGRREEWLAKGEARSVPHSAVRLHFSGTQ